MEPTFLAASPFLPVIGLSVLLLLFHVMLQGMIATKELGTDWNAGPRDDGLEPKSAQAGRAARASSNFRETYPGFIALAFGLILAGDPHGFGLIGAWVWFVCRLVYIPLYLAGIPYIRSLVWLGSVAGIVAMFLVLMF
ncbi:MAPEG family protein [Allorhizobium taibaishanense]|uniref:Putative MAPEG superfamily protein n=1 Tax=Allorhizobium taibaishanense TaxID=887144 RepID=A0A1Q9A2H1_9HYPH|nr:MAPEG family protein [Allorhizobium taibaishanense]MBB4009209.1 putative MAPEG superfamily protein [Allorhizobium taibaishanense]OLP48761.1 hypothetical protein BJF91_00715 [Allorhizobium taibaishanense]